ncbi:FAD binding domain-containing protein [Catenuloplanes atrovinosus]|uniref:Xanthine dehydrogenase YagS FAD-binding subunit n=1 Tax=Catenuloplanes atrovinosus TaxID=137266 RepID=A0AAE3YTD6_9ACTN|nr:xanthine dehydrogenase family protein subunit M [Catenuloplanes atrovinosus]MDR7277536.1 xanthine dehydrogenase YagS FAD-binding subunit [Catenuloplanes atrovinosus]
MRYERPTDLATAVALVRDEPGAAYLAGGTTQLDLQLKDRVVTRSLLVDIGRLPLRGVEDGGDRLTVGALTTMEELAAHPVVAARLPVVREALLAGASVQLRNLATIGGNLLQRTRCRYFRDAAVSRCNKRVPGTGCAAIDGTPRMHAILGAGPECIALHASDLCVALVALHAVVHVTGPGGSYSVPLRDLHVRPGSRPDVETVLGHGDLITAVEVPVPDAASAYLKVRDRASYEFALTSAAAVLRVRDGVIEAAGIGLGGVGTVPWWSREAEDVLVGAPATAETFRAAAEAAVADPFTVPGTEFKVELAKRTLTRVLRTVGERR